MWLAAVLGGFGVLLSYGSAPGEPGRAPERWPGGSALAAPQEEATLLLFAHPRCPCTRAGLEVLDRAASRWRGRPRIEALFYAPAELAPEEAAAWARTGLWERAAAIPGLTIRLDHGGAEARRFGARTSGEVRLYGAGGDLRFAGGLTSARGHEMPGPAVATLATLLGTAPEPAETPNAPTFGCPLLGCDPPAEPPGP